METDKLNPFVDGELDRETREEMLRAIGNDPQLGREVGNLRQIKEMVRHAYETPPPARGYRPLQGRSSLRGLAAAILLTVGALLGWFGHYLQPAGENAAMQTLAANEAVAPAADRILLHVDTNDPRRILTALTRVEQMLDTVMEDRQQPRLEIVAHGEGLELMKAGLADRPHRELERILSEYEHVTLKACKRTLQRLRKAGQEIRLRPGTDDSRTALDEIVRRIHEGWTYIKA
ncbi:MAG TPA: hypothetical protein ENK54_02020 [Thiotrichales bacterium]|nr:hypothetical protein [Thiotrichales bacterium]